MDLDFPDLAADPADAEGWPFDSLTSSLLFSASPPPHAASAPANSFGPPPSPLWLFEDRHLGADSSSNAAGAAAEEPPRLPRCSGDSKGNTETGKGKLDQVITACEVVPSTGYYGADYSCCIRERLTQALRLLKASTNQCLLVQVWAPVKSGDRYKLTTSGQPFVYVEQSDGLYEYRAVSVGYKFSIDSDDDGDLGLPGRVYKQKIPEWTPDVQFYSIKEFLRLNHAVNFNVHGTVALPVFGPSGQSCVAVVELIMTSVKINYASEFDIMCKALEAVNLKSTETSDHPTFQICNEGRQSALAEILKIITIVCEEHKLPLAQTWVPCKYRSVLAYGGGLIKTCSSIDGSCMGEICISASDVAFHIIDSHVWGFRDACVQHHLQKGQGIVGKAYLSGRPCFSNDISKFSKSEYPLVHYARMFGLAGSLAICMKSMHTGTDIYILEFFLPPEAKTDSEQRTLLASILTLMGSCIYSLQFAGDVELSNVSKEVIRLIMKETHNNLDARDHLCASLGGNILEDHQDHEEGNLLLVDKSGQCHADSGIDANGVQASDSLWPDKKTHPTEKKRGKAEKMISLEVLQQYFSGSLKNAARSLGVCPTTMKRICRHHGITRWPSRKINKVNRSLTKLKEVIESVQGSDSALAFASITGPLAVAVNAPDAPESNRTHGNGMAVPPNLDMNGERVALKQSTPEVDAQQHSTRESAHAFMALPDSIQQEHRRALCSQSSSGEHSSNSHTSGGSCQASRVNDLSVCKPVDSAFLESHGHNWKRDGSAELVHDLQQPIDEVHMRDSGSSKDLKLLFGRAVEINPAAQTADPVDAKHPQHPPTVTIKACYKEDIIRFRFHCDQNASVLKDEIARRLDIDVGMFDVKFLDDDNEWVRLVCDADLSECIEISRLAGRQVVRLLISDFTANVASSYGSSG